jgi:citrate lyase subunit beta/citryl-CoA lyase
LAPAKTPAVFSRSWLLENGTKTGSIDFARNSRADQIVVDIYNAVNPNMKVRALQKVAKDVE